MEKSSSTQTTDSPRKRNAITLFIYIFKSNTINMKKRKPIIQIKTQNHQTEPNKTLSDPSQQLD